MQVILKENVENLGQTGDVVKVSDGYARNFLIPKGKGAIATQKNLAQIEHQKRVLQKKRAAERAQAEELVKKLEDYSCTIYKKVGKNEKLFGSVTNAEIAEELQKAGFDIKKANIQLEEPIKALGVHSAIVRVLPEAQAQLKVWVQKEEN